MADIKISQLPAVSTLSRSEIFELVQSGVNKRVAISMVADAPGTAASAIATHIASDNPHTQYLTQTDTDVLYAPVSHTQAISTITGLQEALDGKEALGSATTAINTHVAAADPHTQYLKESDASTTYAPISHTQAISTITGLEAALDDKETVGAAALAINYHVAESDPHTQYLTESVASSTYAPVSHTQASTTITDFTEAVQDVVAATLVQGSNITITYNDAANTITIASSNAPVTSVNGKVGVVTLVASDVGAATASHSHTLATESLSGFMSAEQVAELKTLRLLLTAEL